MRTIPAMVSMERSPEDWASANDNMPMPMGDMPKFFYGLTVALEGPELKKLGLLDEQIEVGDMIHVQSMATVISISKSETEGGCRCRVELQLQHIAAEDEDEEGATNEDAEDGGSVTSKLYVA